VEGFGHRLAEITDAGVKELAGLYAPQQLNLNSEGGNNRCQHRQYCSHEEHETSVSPRTSVTEEGIARLHKALPKCEI
jgi:hypothetical protein